jgi:taurine dioxygenase
MSSTRISALPISGALGAELSGVDVSSGGDADSFREIHRALLDHGVVFIRDQAMSRRAQLDFAGRFGKLEVHPIANGMDDHPEIIRVAKPAGEEAYFGTSWHSDNSFFENPSAITTLYGERIPEYGGDTIFASMERAYDALSDAMKAFLDPLIAVHSASRAYDPRTTGEAKYRGDAGIRYTWSDAITDEVEHPVVRTHPETGRRSLYVNAMFTQRINDLNPVEGDAILALLYAHSARPDFSCRFRWQPGSFAIWDNRCVQHYAVADYHDFERIMYRVTVAGDRPR